MKTTITASYNVRRLALQNGKTVKAKYGFARFVIGGRFEYTPYRSQEPRSYYSSAEDCLDSMLQDETIQSTKAFRKIHNLTPVSA